MRLTKTLVAAALAGTVTASSAFAGGLAVEIVEPPVVVVEPEAPAPRGSLAGPLGFLLPLAAVGALGQSRWWYAGQEPDELLAEIFLWACHGPPTYLDSWWELTPCREAAR